MEDNLATQLTEAEKADLDNLEGVIKRELGSFVVVGRALEEIRAKRLYREGYKNFKDYCNEKWQMGRNFAYKQISGARVAVNLCTDSTHLCEIQPTSEFQIRPLVVLEPDQQREVWEEAVRIYGIDRPGKAPTYNFVKAVAQQYSPPKPKLPPKKIEHSSAHGFVSMAMANLMRIMSDDPLRIEAMQRLIDWAQEKITEWTKEK